MQFLANGEEDWVSKRMGVFLDLKGRRTHQICSFMLADNFWIMHHSKAHLEQMLRDLIQEAEEWELEPKLASLWWTSTFISEEKKDLVEHVFSVFFFEVKIGLGARKLSTESKDGK